MLQAILRIQRSLCIMKRTLLSMLLAITVKINRENDKQIPTQKIWLLSFLFLTKYLSKCAKSQIKHSAYSATKTIISLKKFTPCQFPQIQNIHLVTVSKDLV